jgi:hypothetical protein
MVGVNNADGKHKSVMDADIEFNPRTQEYQAFFDGDDIEVDPDQTYSLRKVTHESKQGQDS